MLPTLFIAPIFHIFEKRINNKKIPISSLLFVDDRLSISQEKPFDKINAHLFIATISFLLY